MSEAEKNLTEIYDDIELCYKVMGLTFSDPPDKVDRVFNGLMEEYNNNLKAGDQAARKQAQENIDQTKDLYERITGSMIYKDYAREYEKYKQLKAEQMAARKQKQESDMGTLVNCPYCRKLISPKLKVCIYCHGKILTPMELLLSKVLSTRNVIILFVVIVSVAVGVFLLMNPNLLTK